VIAAEDQRFYEHPGYDLREIDAAWSLNQQEREAARGGSTITQQLAKLLYAGGERHHVRKLRELLYAVEMDRTLGKARVLNLYLAIAPWGAGQCGAAAAARHYLKKRADVLTPTEAAWLASLLRAPDRDVERYAQRGEVDVDRLRWVIAHLQPLPAARREALLEAAPHWSPRAGEW
jgi:membrane peptidoglycan carboxypeptidase